MRPSPLLVLLALIPTFALAETDQERQARESLERELKSMVATPPTKIKVLVVGLDQPNYELQEASFKLDGRTLPIPGGDLRKLVVDGEHLIFHGDVQPGQHRLESRFTFKNTTSQVVSVEGGYTWKPGSDVSFKTETGIEVTVKVTPELNLSGDIKQRITVKSPATVKMLAKLDDGTMPEPMERPKIAVVVEAPDAGTANVEVVKGETAEEKAKAAAEAKKRAAEEAKAAKLAAAEEKKRKAEEAKAAKLAAAEEKKRQAADAKAAKLAAAEEKKRQAAEAKAAKDNKVAANTGNTGSTGTGGTGNMGSTGTGSTAVAAETVDAGAPVAAAPVEVDAGPAVVAAAPPPVKQPEPTPTPVPEEGALPLPLIIGVGVAIVGLILFLVARRKK